MIIVVGDGPSPELIEPWDFKRFKLRAPRTLSQADVAQKLQNIAKLASEDAVWVQEGALRQMGEAAGDPAWQEQVTAMIAKAGAHGWVDAATGAIRAHIEWV